jgi:hypothetical protein
LQVLYPERHAARHEHPAPRVHLSLPAGPPYCS